MKFKTNSEPNSRVNSKDTLKDIVTVAFTFGLRKIGIEILKNTPFFNRKKFLGQQLFIY